MQELPFSHATGVGMAALIERENPFVGANRLDDWRPIAPALGNAVQKQQGRTTRNATLHSV